MTDTTTHDFGDGKGTVPAHRHANGGGWRDGRSVGDPSAGRHQ
jgi:hypothetical protein